MSAQTNSSLGAVFAITSLVLAVAGCLEPAEPKAGDIVPYRRASGVSSSEGTSTPSLYEYSNELRQVTTGKRIRFHVPNALLDVTDRSDGPKVAISLRYDGQTLDRFTPGTPGHLIGADLKSHARGGNLTPENITRQETVFGPFGHGPTNLSLRGLECGLDAYDVEQNDYTTRHIARYGLTQSEKEFRSRWGGSMLFAFKDDGGVYSDVITCYQISPTCNATTSYRGWPVRLTFPNGRICEYPKIAADARRMFDRFYLDETERSPGQIERRWTPIRMRGSES